MVVVATEKPEQCTPQADESIASSQALNSSCSSGGISRGLK